MASKHKPEWCDDCEKDHLPGQHSVRVHRAPSEGSSTLPCCNVSIFAPHVQVERVTSDPAWVTCKGA